ncbi:TIGR04084 family radical SAM/SPASM domain-containing protein [Hyperthermus butylicus]|uniref:Fe-S oxidoreductase n=1 Tax=Hyperthermus butylicus (strain DSM 5456 / JCM 9403 / PLM1-5) TaxID=415426 RepID=A2BJC6_HYPBU|nr:TIGR04084 family radical SAM/SPASM domain-containing protein [Hyperthermus butylicus]ABM80087.1 putative Fe-S oxidoreductase [Hyperthermus butylicus DSM 5456]
MLEAWVGGFGTGLLWFVFTTGLCNLRCRYCGGGFPPDIVPPWPRYRVEELVELIERVDSRPVVFFYGGEPLLNPGFIREVMDALPHAVFGIQTNAILHNRLGDEYWARFTTVLLSVDGVEGVTDRWRGPGVYSRVVSALRRLQRLRERLGGPATIVARMAVHREISIYRDVMHLLRGLGFDKVHWQLDAVWSPPWRLGAWARESYLPGLRRLARWVAARPRARLHRIVPFHGIVSALYNGGFRWYPCGAGRTAVAVLTDGRIVACPIAVREEWAVLGTLDTWRGRVLPESFVPERCRLCSYYPLCGGRCLYAQVESSYWPGRLLEELDWVTRRTIDIVLEEVVPAVEKAVERGEIDLAYLSYTPELESTEVIP